MRETLQEIVAKSAPPHWLKGIYTRIQHCYAEAHQGVANHPGLDEAQRAILLPYMRRGLVETALHRWSLDCGLNASVEDTKTDSHQFTLIRFGQIAVTISKTSTCGAMPETCGFRKQHSRVNEMLMQQLLFPVPSSTDSDQELIYAIITHGPARGGVDLGFVSLGFPNSLMSAWVEQPVSIFEIEERQTKLCQKPDLDLHEQLQEKQRTPKIKKGVIQKREDEAG
jgi:hypothetical protein